MNRPLKIGLTGGIGSGKSTVCRLLNTLYGVPVYLSDERAKALMVEDSQLRSELVAHFSEQVFTPSGELNRPYLSALVFADEKRLAELNGCVHPAVERDFDRWAEEQCAPYVVEESAILFECGAAQRMDYTVAVTAPETLRVRRTCSRDPLSEEQVRERMSRQLPESDRTSAADFVLYADDQQLLIPQVIALHNQLLALHR